MVEFNFSIFPDFFYIFLSVTFLVIIFLTYNNDFWLKRSIPYVEPQLLFGNIRDAFLMKKTVAEVYKEIYLRLNSKPLGGFFKLNQPIMMVRDPELIGTVLKEKFDCFHDNDINVRRDTESILKMNPLLARGATWKPLRLKLEESLSRAKFPLTIPLILPVCKKMIKYIEANMSQPIDVQEMCARYTTDVIASCSFGKETNSFKENNSFRQMTKQLFNTGLHSNLAMLSAIYAPFLSGLLRLRIVGRKLTEYFTRVVSEICQLRVQENIRRPDFLQELIDINKESESLGEGEVYKYKEMAAHCLTFLINGFYTTSVSISFCLYELARNPQIQSKARSEILAQSSNLDQVNYRMLDKLPYLDRVIKESLRMYTPIHTVTRVCTKNTVLSKDGLDYDVTKGIPVTVPISALHMDPVYFPYPQTFNPDRFSSSNKQDPFTYMPFGEGPRQCPGSKMALLVMKLSIASILMYYSVSVNDKFQLELDPKKYLTTAKSGIWLKFVRL